MKNGNQNKNPKQVIPCSFSDEVVMKAVILAANPSMHGHPAGIQPNPGPAKSRLDCQTRELGGSAMGSGTGLTLAHAGFIVRPSGDVARVRSLQANVLLYGMACGGGPTILSPIKRQLSSCHEVRSQNSSSRLLATAESVVGSGP
jgi:hypothetical protein